MLSNEVEKLIKDPRTFGKFVTFGTLEKILLNRSLQWSRPGTFNDPFDFQIDYSLPIEEEVRKISRKIFEKIIITPNQELVRRNPASKGLEALRRAMYENNLSLEESLDLFNSYLNQSINRMQELVTEASQELASTLARSSILCTTKEVNSLLMWSHYAGGHSGAFLLFKPLRESDWGQRLRVNYSSSVPKIWKTENLAEALTGKIEFSFMVGRKEVLQAILTKSLHWQYENEERFIKSKLTTENHVYQNFDPRELKEIIFGCRVSRDEVFKLKNSLEGRYVSTRLSLARKDTTKFGLRFSEFL